MKEPTSVRIKDSFPIKKDFIEWSDALSVGVQEIDDQHKGLAAMVNEMSEGIKGCLLYTSARFPHRSAPRPAVFSVKLARSP